MMRCLLAPLLCLTVSASAASRTAAQVVLGDGPQHCDCPADLTPKPTATPPLATPTPTPTSTPAPAVQADVEALGFPVQWEGPGLLLITLSDERTRFDKGRDALKPESLQRLQALAGVLKRYPGNTLKVSGHTDSQGVRRFNLGLSLRRAEQVRTALVGMGVPAESFETVEGLGPDRPVGDNATDEGRAMNRRVELRLNFHALALPAASATGSAAWVSGSAATDLSPSAAPSPDAPKAAP